jgi:predicted GNAT family N-acyltransferase
MCDVFVDREFRGLGLGEYIVRSALAHPEVQDVHLFLLATRDAHDLYRRFGFTNVSEPERWMVLESSTLRD